VGLVLCFYKLLHDADWPATHECALGDSCYQALGNSLFLAGRRKLAHHRSEIATGAPVAERVESHSRLQHWREQCVLNSTESICTS
jgi:hypothetical protein